MPHARKQELLLLTIISLVGVLTTTPVQTLANQSETTTMQMNAEPLPAIIALRSPGSNASSSIAVLDLATNPEHATWFSATSSGMLGPADPHPLTWLYHQNADNQALNITIQLDPVGQTVPDQLILEIIVPELPGVLHDWLAFHEQSVTTGIFTEQQDQPEGRDDTTTDHSLPIDKVALRTNTDGYLVLDQMEGIESALQFEDDRSHRPAFTARLLIQTDNQSTKLSFRLRQLPFLDVMRSKDRALAIMHPTRASFASQGPPAIDQVALSNQGLNAYDPLTITADIRGQWINPFDPDDVTLDALITRPDGSRVSIPGFLNQPHRTEMVNGEQFIRPTGQPEWQVRYTPSRPGRHTVVLHLHDGTEPITSEPLSFDVEKANRRGFIRIAQANPYYFEFEDGSLYFPIGMNVGWSGQAGTEDYNMYFSQLARHEANFARIWLGPTFNRMGLERAADPEQPGANGLGWIDLQAAWKIDEVFNIAQQNDIRLMVAIESFSAMRDSAEPRHWHESPYNVALGGPLRRTGEMLSDPTARKLFKHRLRYIVARYGHHTSLLNWELWNEVNGIDGYNSADAATWHAEMADQIKSLDVYEHPVATSFWINHGDEAVDQLPQLDFTQTHIYGASDIPRYFIPIARRKLDKYQKPHLFGEYGVNVSAEGSTGVDLDGIHLHNGHWAALLSGSAGGPMVWWWDNYVHPNNLYNRFTPLARFVQDMPLNKIALEPVHELIISHAQTNTETSPRRPLVIRPEARSWNACDANRPRDFKIYPDGYVSDFDVLPAALHSDQGGNAHLHNPPTFKFTLPEPATFTVHVEGISGWSDSRLQITVNEERRIDQHFPDNNGRDQQMIHTYDGPYTVELPAGNHVVTVANKGRDWMNVSYEISNYLRADQPQIDVWAARFTDTTPQGLIGLVWLRDQAFTWKKQQDNPEPRPSFQNLRLTIPGLDTGEYTVEWWNTFTGEIIKHSRATASKQALTLDIPPLHKSLAGKLRRASPSKQSNPPQTP
ncbi:hypothetical protein [Mucisphaera sp.]|uniref:hypothetical protein n=1 Tax=Mucisphaera sp. TaxID=2913024 RepID=UPI003D139B77